MANINYRFTRRDEKKKKQVLLTSCALCGELLPAESTKLPNFRRHFK